MSFGLSLNVGVPTKASRSQRRRRIGWFAAASALSMSAFHAPAAGAQQTTLAAQAGTKAAEFRDQIGRRLTFICPAHVNINQDIYGTDVYSDTSPICTAAAHAGFFTRGTSTAVTILMTGPTQALKASTRNSVTSLAYGPWAGGYSFVRDGPAGQIDWYTTIATVPTDYQLPITVICPPGAGAEQGDIWGTDAYSSDSAICVAGVHAGAITMAGGMLTVTRLPKQASFPSTTRYEITSRMWSDPAWRSYPQPYAVSNAGGFVGTGVTSGAGGSAPFAVTVTTGNAGPVVTWTAAPNASGYIVSRSKIDDLNCCNSTSGRTFTATSPWQDGPLPTSGTYVYKVTASTPAGSVIAETQFGFRMPGDNTAVGTPTVNGVLVQPTTTFGTATPMSTTGTATTGTVVTERAPRDTPTLMNTGRPPEALTANPSPVRVSLYWGAPGAASLLPPPTGYEVRRMIKGQTGTPWQLLTTKPITEILTYDDIPPDRTLVYTYEVTAIHQDGSRGAATVDAQLKRPVDPSGFSARVVGAGEVELSWDSGLPDVSSYFVIGPGTGNGMIAPATLSGVTHRWTFTLKGLPAGTHTWSIAASYDPGGVLTRAGDWPEATATVGSDPAPRYRLVALGFIAHQQSKEINDARDGHGDEVYFTAMVNRTKLTGSSLPVTSGANLTMVMTRSHGDEAVSVPYGRIKAGTASATGGIRSGDAVPANLNPGAPTGALQTLTFPTVVWEGELAETDVVIVHPVLWEDEINPLVQATWAKALTDAAASGYVNFPLPDGASVLTDYTARQIWSMNRATLSTGAGIDRISNGLEPNLLANGRMGNVVFQCNVALVTLTRRPCETHGVDRPIGLEAGYVRENTSDAPWFDRVIFLSKGSVEAALSGTPYAAYAGWPRGTFSLKLRDKIASEPYPIEAIASYELFFRIERVR